MTEQELRDIFSAKIRRYRRERGISQSGLAEKLNISVNFLCNIENGRRGFSFRKMLEIAAVLNVEPHELLSPAEALPHELPPVLDRYLDDLSDGVAQTIKRIRNHYAVRTEAPPKD